MHQNKLDLQYKSGKNNAEISGNYISFSESCNSLKLTNSIKNMINENNQKESYSSSINNISNNIELENTAANKYTFKKESTINQLKNLNTNINKDTFDINKKKRFSKETNNINSSNVIKNALTYKDRNLPSADSNTEEISKFSRSKNEFLILEDINTNFAKKMKKQINKRKKIEKIRHLFELQKEKYKNNLFELYSQFNNSLKL